MNRGGQTLLAASVVGSLLLAACSSGGSGASQGVVTGPLVGNELKYGASPRQDSTITYQPDVVFVGGADSVKSVSADGLVWTISGGAEHVDELQPGKIMFASSLGVGRVLAVSQSGADKLIVLGPADITEIVRDGDFSSPGPLSLDSVQAYTVPDRPGLVSDISESSGTPGPASTPEPSAAATPTPDTATPTDTATPSATTTSSVTRTSAVQQPESAASNTLRLPAVHFMAHIAGQPAVPALLASDVSPPGTLPLPTLSPPPVSLGSYSITSTCCKGGPAIRVAYDSNGVRMSGTLRLHLDRPSFVFNLKFAGGRLVNANIVVHGAGGLAVDFTAVAVNGLNGNVPQRRVEVPVDFQVPVYGLPVPITIGLEQLFSLSTTFTATKAEVQASGDYTFGGSLGFGLFNGKPDIYYPQGFATKTGMLDTALGVSAGPSSISLGYAVKFSVGVGFLGFRAGLWFEITFRVGLAVSALTSLVLCRTASLSAVGKYGIGYSIPKAVATVINVFLKIFHARPILPSSGIEGPPFQLFEPKSDTVPQGSACS